MKAWLVRSAGNETEDQINAIGIVFADNFHDLWDSIDEIANPHEFEYCRIPSTKQLGIFLANVAESIPDRVSDVFVGDDAHLEFSRGKWKTFVELVGDYDAFYRNRYRFPESQAMASIVERLIERTDSL